MWPGTGPNRGQDEKYHPSSVTFTSPLFNGTENYSRVAFEADLPRIEAPDSGGVCDRFTGADLREPASGLELLPVLLDRVVDAESSANGHCVWQLGAGIKGTTNTFGGSSAAEFGAAAVQPLPEPGPGDRGCRTNNFRNVLGSNPCPA